MSLSESSTKSKEVKVNIDPYQQGRSQPQHRQNNLSFTLRPKFSGACGALTGQTFSGGIPNDFKGTPDNIAI